VKLTTTLGILAVLGGLLLVPASAIHAQDVEQSNPWIAKAQEDAAQPDSKKQIPVLSSYYAGDIEFIDEPVPANVSIDQVKGKLSGSWNLNLVDQGSFTGNVTSHGKVTFELTYETGGPHCKIKLTGVLSDGIGTMSGKAKMNNCGKAGKHLGKGSFEMQNG
jgi:hypothetical protein